MREQKKYDSTIVRVAGNIASGMIGRGWTEGEIAQLSVAVARAIVAEVERTEPESGPEAR